MCYFEFLLMKNRNECDTNEYIPGYGFVAQSCQRSYQNQGAQGSETLII